MEHIRVVDQQFKIKVEQQQPALEALKKAIRDKPAIVNADGETVLFDLQHGEQVLTAKNLIQAFSLRHWLVGGLPDGTITGLDTNDEEKPYWQEEESFFQVLAPFIEPGYLEVKLDESDAHWRWKFDGQTCQSVYPTIMWPEYGKEA